jgi:hypothetical protein
MDSFSHTVVWFFNLSSRVKNLLMAEMLMADLLAALQRGLKKVSRLSTEITHRQIRHQPLSWLYRE